MTITRKGFFTISFTTLFFAALVLSSCGQRPVQDHSEAVSSTGVSASSVEAALTPSSEAEEIPEAASSAEWAGYTDADFLFSVRKGLEERWASVRQQDGASLDTEAFREYASAAVQKELDAIGDLYYYKFEDQALGSLASTYYAALKDQLVGISESESQDDLRNSEAYMTGYCLRTVSLYILRENYGLAVAPEYQANFDSAVSRYEAAKQYLGME